MSKIHIKNTDDQKSIYHGKHLIAKIVDHRGKNNARGDWSVEWSGGRVDWHNSYAEARDNALKGW